MMKPHFTAEIQLGHLIQAGALLSAVIGGYMGLRSSIDTQNALFDKRLTLVEQSQVVQARDDISWRSEMRASNQSLNTAIGQLSGQIADLRVAIANKADRK